jgi:heavy metal sensor kinase
MKLFRTVRFRIAAWNALGASLVALLALVGVRQGVKWTILAEMDQILAEDAREIELALADDDASGLDILADDLHRKAIGHKHHGWFVTLVDEQGAILWTSDESRSWVESVEGLPGNNAVTDGGFRSLHTSPAPNRYRVARIVVGSSLDYLQDDMRRVDRLVLGAAVAILFTAPFCGYWLAGRATRAVGTITATASRLRPDQLNERLSIQGSGDEFDQLSQTINHLLDRIAAYIQQKRDFLANSAHELRTPLAAIRSSIEVALANERSRETYRELLEDLIEEGAALETLVNQLLLLSESEADPDHMNWETVPLHEVVTKSIDMFGGVAESRNITLSMPACNRVFVSGNRSHLRQVVNNLLDNAIKYTPDGGTIVVGVAPGEDRRVARLTVADTGPGIPAGDLPLVFDRFFRSDRARRRDEMRGTGLGLSICKAIIEAHDGTILCQSNVGEGTTLVVELGMCMNGERGTQLSHASKMAAGTKPSK